MTDTATPSAEPESGPADSGPPQPGPPAEAAAEDGEPGPIRRRRRWLRWTAVGAAVTVLAAAGTAWTLYERLDANIRTDPEISRELDRHAADRPASVVREAVNILLIGSDDRGGGNARYGRDSGTQRSDTTMLLHLSADRSHATAVSIPRDLMVDVPACTKPDGSRTAPQFAQFNWAFQFGGAACTIRTVEELTGVRMDHHVIVDFTGFRKMVDAIGGVEFCLEEPVDDDEAHVKLPAGPQTLDGEEALGYVRARYSLGDGTDTARMTRQQEFLATVMEQLRAKGTLQNPAELYALLDAATSSLTTDSGLASLGSLYELAESVRGLPEDGIRFLTVPRQPYHLNVNRDELVQPDASELFEELRNDLPVTAGGEGTENEEDRGEDPGERPEATAGSGADGASTPGPTSDGPAASPSGSATPPGSSPTATAEAGKRPLCG
ncbi:LCP family protein [Streptomyces zingiberis]|uniref:LCP family protein n=1 Tax=Streptomyces zingiberis TaxID=2053010 RepID=UPI0035D3F0EC